SDGYLKEVRKICDEKGLLLILDEVQTGIGRTGTLFAYEQFGVEPDIMTLAKGLGGGVPIGAMLAKEGVAESFVPGTHASTFGGNPLVTYTAIATIEKILEDGILLEECKEKGEYFIKRLKDLEREHSNIVVDVRGLGLMVGIEISRDCAPIVEDALKKGLLINCTAGNTLRFTPPLIISKGEIDILIDFLDDTFGRLV
ncbi:MAG: aminotransferase class III-fold pyridoxal phosphate-dependent enzyme, partial [Nitrospirae bacterium]